MLRKPSSIYSHLLYDKVSEKFVVTVKLKALKNPWITKSIVKS